MLSWASPCECFVAVEATVFADPQSIVLCAIYYVVWIVILPKRGGYEYRQTVLDVPGGGVAHALVKVPNDELEQWDAVHDASGVKAESQRSRSEEEKEGSA